MLRTWAGPTCRSARARLTPTASATGAPLGAEKRGAFGTHQLRRGEAARAPPGERPWRCGGHCGAELRRWEPGRAGGAAGRPGGQGAPPLLSSPRPREQRPVRRAAPERRCRNPPRPARPSADQLQVRGAAEGGAGRKPPHRGGGGGKAAKQRGAPASNPKGVRGPDPRSLGRCGGSGGSSSCCCCIGMLPSRGSGFDGCRNASARDQAWWGGEIINIS